MVNGGAKLVADLRGETRLAVDPLLQRSGHVVERRDQRCEVGIGREVEASVELATGDGACRFADVSEREQRSSARPRSERSTGEGRDDRRSEQREAERRQALLEIAQVEDLEVDGVQLRERNTHTENRPAIHRVAHLGGGLVQDHHLFETGAHASTSFDLATPLLAVEARKRVDEDEDGLAADLVSKVAVDRLVEAIEIFLAREAGVGARLGQATDASLDAGGVAQRLVHGRGLTLLQLALPRQCPGRAGEKQ